MRFIFLALLISCSTQPIKKAAPKKKPTDIVHDVTSGKQLLFLGCSGGLHLHTRSFDEKFKMIHDPDIDTFCKMVVDTMIVK